MCHLRKLGSKSSLSRFFHKQTQHRPLKACKPRDNKRCEKIVEQRPCVKELWPVDGNQGKGNPMAEAVAAGNELAEEGISLLCPLPEEQKKLHLGYREGYRGRDE